ncbi:MAG TPA: leucyl/phenylalanyl-tRNA--protein transferase [Stellaceae bacterium]|jgi:leucyl/phenylalanyl-tRNA--protein transferase|nr:leucyl/phenylalanyl-tRNA--protein transferase [Stellaceae bacterium]
MIRLDPDLLLRAYAAGIFPMADDAGSAEIFWVDPEERGIMPLDAFHLSRRLRRTVRGEPFEIRSDHDFVAVMKGCAAATEDRPKTWINEELIRLYAELFRRGHAHTVESWLDGELVGGLYGVTLGGVFFGESMFSRVTDASKVALAHLVARLRLGGYTLLDIQFVTPHLKRFGAVAISRARYRRLLGAGMAARPVWPAEALGGDQVVVSLAAEPATVSRRA